MRRTPEMRNDDWVQVSIRDDGMYTFKSYRTIGVFSGRGQLTLNQGKATVRLTRGIDSFSMKQMEFACCGREATKEGIEYASDLTPAK